MNMISCPDGRQLLMIMTTTKKDAGLYECVATNPLASVSSSCTLSLARKSPIPQREKEWEIEGEREFLFFCWFSKLHYFLLYYLGLDRPLGQLSCSNEPILAQIPF